DLKQFSTQFLIDQKISLTPEELIQEQKILEKKNTLNNLPDRWTKEQREDFLIISAINTHVQNDNTISTEAKDKR
ncbi:MAG: hypothetical protein LBD11_02150, partial [Candidatus Peribacteria bacterium]|nr:hypothetical protein [Candidatus Peribacteria bacterium]